MKKLVGSDIGSFVFDPALRTITFSGLPEINLANILVVTNVTSGMMLYNFADAALGGSYVNGALILEAATESMSATDVLQIWVDVPIEVPVAVESAPLSATYTWDVNLASVFGEYPLVDANGLKCSAVWGPRRTVFGVLFGANSELRVDCTGMSSVTIQVEGSWSGVLQVEGSVNGGSFSPINVVDTQNSQVANRTNITVGGVFTACCAGMKSVRVRFSVVYYALSQPNVTLCAAPERSIGMTQPTTDWQLYASIGSSQLYTPAHTELGQWPQDPTISPNQPSSYVSPKFAQYPQRFRRLRVESGGSERLPFAQEPGTNKLIASVPDVYSKVEELLLQQQITNKLLALAFKLSIPDS